MDNLMQVLGIGGDIASSVQKKRDNLGDIIGNQMTAAIYDQGVREAPVYERIFDPELLQGLRDDFVENYEKKSKRGGLKSIENYKYFVEKYDKAIEDSVGFIEEKKYWEGTPENNFEDGVDKELIRKVNEYRENYMKWGTDEINDFTNEFEKYVYSLGKRNLRVKNKYGAKVKNDIELNNDMLTANNLAKEVLGMLREEGVGPASISQEKYNLLVEGLYTNDDKVFNEYDTLARGEKGFNLSAVNSQITDLNTEKIAQETIVNQAVDPETKILAQNNLTDINTKLSNSFELYRANTVTGDFHILDPRRDAVIMSSASKLFYKKVTEGGVDEQGNAAVDPADMKGFIDQMISEGKAPASWARKSVEDIWEEVMLELGQ
tara:strand:+ start:1839 stop:2969 length:1131 start_codon:yes stop_codon:yes gene_type:complete